MIPKKHFLSILLLTICFSKVQAQSPVPFIETLNSPNKWVDSVFKSMTRNQKIAQLFMVRAHTDLGTKYADSVGHIIKKEHLGGVVFFQGSPTKQAILTNKYQALSKIPLMIAMDAEWGLAMRLDSTISYPYQMTLGAIQNEKLIYRMGQEVAKDFKRLGMHINFAPVIDVNNNPKNPVINYRSFGENKYNVAQKGIAYFKGMQESGIFTTAKHFPGHGDTDVDSHYNLPKLPFTSARLDSLEMYPFKRAIASNLSGIMIAHMNIPALDNTPNLPSTLSKPIITDVLKKKLGFKGLIFTDAMEMKGVVKFFPNGEADVKALIAGNDVIELSENTDRAIKLVKKSIRHHRLSWADIDEKVRKILIAKYWMGLNRLNSVNTKNVVEDLNRPSAKLLNQELADAAVTLIKGEELFPLKNDFVRKTAIINIGASGATLFSDELKKIQPNGMLFSIAKNASYKDLQQIKAALKNYDQMVLTIYDTRKRPAGTLDYNNDIKLFIADVASLNTITTVFANPYTLAGLPGIEKSKGLVITYQNSPELQQAAGKLFQGKLKAKGKLPVTINSFFKYGDGITME